MRRISPNSGFCFKRYELEAHANMDKVNGKN